MKVLITAGPTREYLDPVRYLSNASSGKMGYALANAAKKLGWSVTLVTGPVELKPLKGINLIDVVSAKEMQKACLKKIKYMDLVIMAAAVCDYRPVKISKIKIKRGSKKERNLKLIANPDILKEICTKKRNDQIVVGFAVETTDLIKNAKKKLKTKKCDWIIANKANAIGSDENKVTLISSKGKKISLPKMGKEDLAMLILSYLINSKKI